MTPHRYEDEPPAQPHHARSRSHSGDGSYLPLAECRSYPIQVTLPPGGKPVRVVLALRTSRAGSLQLLGCTCSAWGMEWVQPFVGGKGNGLSREAAKLKGLQGNGGQPVAVSVLPALPTIRAVLQGAELQVRCPTPASLVGTALVLGLLCCWWHGRCMLSPGTCVPVHLLPCMQPASAPHLCASAPCDTMLHRRDASLTPLALAAGLLPQRRGGVQPRQHQQRSACRRGPAAARAAGAGAAGPGGDVVPGADQHQHAAHQQLLRAGVWRVLAPSCAWPWLILDAPA